jgi:hypothetical protein
LEVAVNILCLIVVLVFVPNLLFAANDGIYVLTETTPAVWDGTNATVPQTATADYDAITGDDATLAYSLPTAFSGFTFYRVPYSHITVDTNGNIWFANSNSAYAINLPAAGKGPVISAWNSDLSSYVNGGVFIQHKTSPERVVIEWQTDTYSDEGSMSQNNFEVVLFSDGKIRIDYKGFAAASPTDFGSGVSKDNNENYVSISDPVNYGSVYNLAGRSFLFKDVTQSTSNTASVNFTGTGTGTVTSSPIGIACNSNCSFAFYTGEQITLHPSSSFSLFSGWSNSLCNGTGDCKFVLNTDSTITADFSKDTAHQVYLTNGNPLYYSTILSAYSNAVNDSVIKTWATDYTETVNLNRTPAISITLQGGYDHGYVNQSGMTVLHGTLKISQGKVIADGIAIR